MNRLSLKKQGCVLDAQPELHQLFNTSARSLDTHLKALIGFFVPNSVGHSSELQKMLHRKRRFCNLINALVVGRLFEIVDL